MGNTAVSRETLTEFLLARIAEDEAAIPTGPPAPWIKSVHPAYDGDIHWHMSEHHVRFVREGYECRVADCWHEDVAAHIARHDPARVLAECEAKRRVIRRLSAYASASALDEWTVADSALVDVVKILATVHADHRDYREEWRP